MQVPERFNANADYPVAPRASSAHHARVLRVKPWCLFLRAKASLSLSPG